MHLENNRVVIDPDDNPSAVTRALDYARTTAPQAELSEHNEWLRQKSFEEARDFVRDGFGVLDDEEMLKPNGRAQTLLGVSGLQEALTLYRDKLRRETPVRSVAVNEVDDLLAKAQALQS